METHGISDDQIRGYVLGNERPELVEQLDELSFTDEIAERIGLIENDLIDEYLNGTLESEERSSFESHYLSSPRRRQKLAFAKTLTAMADRERRSAPAVYVRPKTLFDSLREFRFALRLGLAAAAVVLVSIFGWVFLRSGNGGPTVAVVTEPSSSPVVKIDEPVAAESPSAFRTPEPPIGRANSANRRSDVNEKDPTGTSKPPAVVALVLPPPMRGDSVKTVSVPVAADKLSVSLELEGGEFSKFQVVLRDESTKSEPWKSGMVRTSRKGDGKVLSFNLPATLLKPGIYTLNVSGVSADGAREIVGDYLFRVVR